MKKMNPCLDIAAGRKQPYTSPRIESSPLELEYGIAVASAVVRPPENAGEIKTEWEIGTDRSTDLDW